MRSSRIFSVPCRFGESAGTFQVHVGRPAAGFSATHFQVEWLAETRGGVVAEEILAGLEALAVGPVDLGGERDDDPAVEQGDEEE